MAKRHLSRNVLSDIGRERIEILTSLAEKAVREDRRDRAIRYVILARRVGMKTRTGIPKEFGYCKKCFYPMIPGVSCRVRLNGHAVVTFCENCGEAGRKPYIREQRK